MGSFNLTDLAYLAGVLDSDGYIRIHRATKKQTTNAGTAFTGTYYSAQAGIAGTRREPHDLAQSIFGGSVHAYTPKNPRHRIQYQWVSWGNDAVSLLTAVRPFLRIKAEQADLVVELQRLVQAQFAEVKATTRPPYRIPEEMVAERATLFDQVTALNQSRRNPAIPSGRTHDDMPERVQ